MPPRRSPTSSTPTAPTKKHADPAARGRERAAGEPSTFAVVSNSLTQPNRYACANLTVSHGATSQVNGSHAVVPGGADLLSRGWWMEEFHPAKSFSEIPGPTSARASTQLRRPPNTPPRASHRPADSPTLKPFMDRLTCFNGWRDLAVRRSLRGRPNPPSTRRMYVYE
jgi:hypothetical protein